MEWDWERDMGERREEGRREVAVVVRVVSQLVFLLGSVAGWLVVDISTARWLVPRYARMTAWPKCVVNQSLYCVGMR